MKPMLCFGLHCWLAAPRWIRHWSILRSVNSIGRTLTGGRLSGTLRLCGQRVSTQPVSGILPLHANDIETLERARRACPPRPNGCVARPVSFRCIGPLVNPIADGRPTARFSTMWQMCAAAAMPKKAAALARGAVDRFPQACQQWELMHGAARRHPHERRAGVESIESAEGLHLARPQRKQAPLLPLAGESSEARRRGCVEAILNVHDAVAELTPRYRTRQTDRTLTKGIGVSYFTRQGSRYEIQTGTPSYQRELAGVRRSVFPRSLP